MASKGKDVADGAAIGVMKDVKVNGANSKKSDDVKFLTGKIGRLSVDEHVCNHGPAKNKAVPELQQPPQVERPRPVRKERLEDIFQDEVIKRFARMADFKKFALSKDGLSLSSFDVETIIEDYRHSEEQRMQMLSMWRQKQGKNATPQRIRGIVEGYHKAQEEQAQQD